MLTNLTALAFFALLPAAAPGLTAQSLVPPRRPDSTGGITSTGELKQRHKITA